MEKKSGKNIYLLYTYNPCPVQKKLIFTTTSEAVLVGQVKKMIRRGEAFCGERYWKVNAQIHNFNLYYKHFGLTRAMEQCWEILLVIMQNGVEGGIA